MHIFDYQKIPCNLLTPEIVNMLSALHEFKGKQELYIETKPDVLTALLDIAKIQSTKASNKIEGIYTSDERLEALVMEKAEPRNRSEEEIVGYREVLTTVHESYEYIPVRPNNILQLHRDLYSFSKSDLGGKFKNIDNVIAESGKDGKQWVRFIPVPAFQTPEAMEQLCSQFDNAIDEGRYDPLILIPMFILDFLCIHPFNDGNGRMSRLLTLLLLYRSGYIVGKYISMEMLIEKSKETYYEVLQDSSYSWHEGTNDYIPFVKYYLGIMLKGYKEFQDRVEHLNYRKLSKADRVKAVFDKKLGIIKKSDIVVFCPDISETTIERTLKELLENGYIEKVGKARATGYVRKE
ncbi:Fic family protein [uncultured Parabacteroides sp.]|uniref:Fic family protein n=1 Tax=uncultured Parabacteroides sp. TaxID=512312 RepID=UPI00260A449D|nr:Fic family protein [uncultured Parabacteroides sp.]